MVQLRVEDAGQAVLIYTMRTVSDAAEMTVFLRDFFPQARFVVEPLRH